MKMKSVGLLAGAIVLAFVGTMIWSNPTAINGKTIELTAPCRLSKDPAVVYVSVNSLEFEVELPSVSHGKAEDGWKTWIELVGICRLEPQGGPMTAEHCDGYIEVEKINFLNQADSHRKSLKIRR